MEVPGSILSVFNLFLFNRECLFVNEFFFSIFTNVFYQEEEKVCAVSGGF